MKPYYYIFRINGDKPTVRHKDLKSATKESLRLAKKHPDESFEILMCIGISHIPSVKTFWMDGVVLK